MHSDVRTTTSEISSRRKYGRATCVVKNCELPMAGPASSSIHAVDAFVEGLGLAALGERWAEVSRRDAEAIIREILRFDQAYHMAMMSENEASGLTERFMSLFGESTRCFTNGNFVLQ